jgi:hypothetical protein
MDTQNILSLLLADEPSLLRRVQAASQDQQAPDLRYAINKLAWQAWSGSLELWFVRTAFYHYLNANVDPGEPRIDWASAIRDFRLAIAASDPTFTPYSNRGLDFALTHHPERLVDKEVAYSVSRLFDRMVPRTYSSS